MRELMALNRWLCSPRADGRPSFWERPGHALPDREKPCRGATLVGQRWLAVSTVGRKSLHWRALTPRKEFRHVGHSRPMRPKPREHVCPLLPESGQTGRRFGTSALCQKLPWADATNEVAVDHLVGDGNPRRWFLGPSPEKKSRVGSLTMSAES